MKTRVVPTPNDVAIRFRTDDGVYLICKQFADGVGIMTSDAYHTPHLDGDLLGQLIAWLEARKREMEICDDD